MPDRLDHWLRVLTDSGLRLTQQRLELLREIASSQSHPDAETIHRSVRGRLPTVSLDTVYRTLWMLHDLGLIETLSHRRDGIRFDPNLSRHHHFVCVQCGSVRDFESPELNALTVPASVGTLGGVIEARVEVRGVCTPCSLSPTHPVSPTP